MHQIVGEIRKDVYTKEGNGNKGPWKMYAVELSERFKDKDGNTQYTNYRATFFASQNQIQYYDEWIAKGKVISASCQTLEVQVRDSNGKTYITLNMNQPQLVFFQSNGNQQSGNNGGQQRQNQSGWGSPQQPTHSGGGQQQKQSNDTPMDFDDDIPF